MVHKVILHAIRRQVLKLSTKIKEFITLARVIFEQKLLSNWTIPVVVLTINPSIDQRIAPIVLAPQTLLTTATNEVVADVALGGTLVNRNPQQVSWIGFNTITSGNIRNAVSVKNDPSPVLIGIVATFPISQLLYVQTTYGPPLVEKHGDTFQLSSPCNLLPHAPASQRPHRGRIQKSPPFWDSKRL